MTRAVIMARGLGTRMRRADPDARLSPEQAAVAAQGVKGMIPIGRPFMDYILSALADAGYREICLVIGPEHGFVRDYYEKVSLERLRSIVFAIQAEPRGTADAVLAAESFAGLADFLVLNSDNYYPVDACRDLRALKGPGLVGFAATQLIAGGIPADRVRSFPQIQADDNGCLLRLDNARAGEERVSMNCWRFTPRIFEACRAIPPSLRGEWELPDAVQFAIERLGECYRVLFSDKPVLDVSSRGDIAAVAERLSKITVRL